MPPINLTDEEHAMLRGDAGRAAQIAAEIVVRMAKVTGADRLIPVTSAHIDGCLYHGPVSTDFARQLVDAGGAVSVPTTLNVGAIDMIHPELFRGSQETAAASRELARLYTALGCRSTWTCAPYQLAKRPAFGEHIAWAESNAIVFANSVLGARTARYGDFIDIAAAITGRVPHSGLHRDEDRLGHTLFRLERVSPRLAESDVLFATLGHVIGKHAAGQIPVVEGIERATEDQLKALGAAAASSGSIGMFHVVGVTPEAETLSMAFGGRAPARVIDVSRADLAAAAAELSPSVDEPISAVSVGTPHFSLEEFRMLRALIGGRTFSPLIDFYVSTGRDMMQQIDAAGWLDELQQAGVQIVTDTCTYITPIIKHRTGVVMTNSAKWAWYAPGNTGLRPVFGSLRECVETAVNGELWRDESLWRD
jgi:predicted aconitase